MMGRLRRLHPFLFVVIPVLNVMVRNPGAATLRDVLALAFAMLVGCALVYAAAILAFRNRVEREAVPLLVSLVVALFYAYPMFRVIYNQARGDPGRLVMTGTVLLALMGAALAGLWWLAGRPGLLIRANTFFGVMGLLLVAFLGARVFADQLRARSQLGNSVLARRLSQPIPLKSHPKSEPLPDIYIVILDEYANSSVLQERFGFDNRAFEDSLRRLGFSIPTLVRSNYAQTRLSLPSLLNFSYLTDLERELDPRQTDPTLPNHLVENNRTVSFLKNRGYRFAFFPSQWWSSTERNRHADFQFSAWKGFHPGRAATRSDLRRAFVTRTPLALLHGDHHDADYVKRVLGGLAQLRVRQRSYIRSGSYSQSAQALRVRRPLQTSCEPARAQVGSGTGEGLSGPSAVPESAPPQHGYPAGARLHIRPHHLARRRPRDQCTRLQQCCIRGSCHARTGERTVRRIRRSSVAWRQQPEHS